MDGALTPSRCFEHFQCMSRSDVDLAVAKVAAERAGAFHREDVAAAGGDERIVRSRSASGLWLPKGPDVFVLASHRDSLDQRRWLGLLAAGAGSHLSHESAAELHRLDGIVRGRIVVTANHGHHVDIPSGRLRQLDDVLPHHRTEIAGFPTTTAARTMLDLASWTSFHWLRVAAQDLVVRRLATFGELDAVIRETRRRGKPGIRKLVKVLSTLQGEPPPESHLERLLLDVIRRAGLAAVAQHPLPTQLPIRGLVDFAVVESKLILEADGRRWHARLQAMANDRQRDREAAALGWQTLRFMSDDLRNDPAGEARNLRSVHDQRLRDR
jgi:very-short-patch-repair endonuclease